MDARGLVPRGYNGQIMNLVPRIHLKPGLRLHQAIPPAPYSCKVIFMYADGQIYVKFFYQPQCITVLQYAFRHHAEKRRNSEDVCLLGNARQNYAGTRTTYDYVPVLSPLNIIHKHIINCSKTNCLLIFIFFYSYHAS